MLQDHRLNCLNPVSATFPGAIIVCYCTCFVGAQPHHPLEDLEEKKIIERVCGSRSGATKDDRRAFKRETLWKRNRQNHHEGIKKRKFGIKKQIVQVSPTKNLQQYECCILLLNSFIDFGTLRTIVEKYFSVVSLCVDTH